MQTVELSPATNKARLIVLTGADFGRVHRFSGEITIGREPGSTIRLDVPDVSRNHCRIWPEPDGSWHLEDLDSRNGTMSNGVPVKGKQRLVFGDRVQVGGSLLFIFTHYDHLEEQVLQLQKMDSIGRLASGVAHDFKNLLAAVINNVDYLESAVDEAPPPTKEIHECLADTKDAIRRAVALTERLLGFSRPGKDEEHPTDVAAVASEVVRLCRRTFPESIQVETSLHDDLMVMGDSNQLHQALMNLCINARDAMADGGKLLIQAREIKVDTMALLTVPVSEAGDYVVLTVSDTGSGMDDATRRRAFEPFFTTKQPKKGTGLGLAMVFAIVSNHGGRVQLDSELDKGTTFSLYLPSLAVSDTQHVTLRATTVRSEDNEGANTILLADDEEVFRVSMERVLRKLGYEVLLADSGEEVLRLYERNARKIKLVMLDVMMPKLGAEETFNILRNCNPHIRVLLISGSVPMEEVKHLLDLGARGFLPKPFEITDLQRAITDAIKS